MKMTTVGKAAVLVLYIWGAIAFITPESVWRPDLAKLVFGVLLATHAVEAVAFTKKLVDQVGGSAAYHAVQLILFGVLHIVDSGAKIGRLGGAR